MRFLTIGILLSLFSCATSPYMTIDYPNSGIKIFDLANLGSYNHSIPIIPGAKIQAISKSNRGQKFKVAFDYPNNTPIKNIRIDKTYVLSYSGNVENDAINEMTDSINLELNKLANLCISAGGNILTLTHWEHKLNKHSTGSHLNKKWEADFTLYAQAYK